MTDNVKTLKAVKKAPVSPEQKELADTVRALIPRIEAGEITAIYACLVTVDPEIEGDDEAFEVIEAGYNYDEGGVYAALCAMASDVLESWREDFMPRPDPE